MAITPEEFKIIATKDDIKQLREEIASKKDVQTILSSLDAMNKHFDTFETEGAANILAHTRFQETFENHSKRITKLEARGVAA